MTDADVVAEVEKALAVAYGGHADRTRARANVPGADNPVVTVSWDQIRALVASVKAAEGEVDVAASLYHTTKRQLAESDERNAALREQLGVG
jgi:hypothetical protein